MRAALTAMTMTLGVAAVPTLSLAADDMTAMNGIEDVTAQANYSFLSITSNEMVYGGSGRRVSQLIWKSVGVQVLGGSVEVDLSNRYWLKLNGSVGFAGDGHMVDYDWTKPYSPGNANNQWSDRSLHPDTRLNHYFAFDLQAGRDFQMNETDTIGLGAGFRYTDVKWTAWGGSYVYSISGYRDSRGNFRANSKGISYRQAWPVPYLGIDFTRQSGDWTITGALDAGVTVGGYDVDDHWVRNLRFIDTFNPAPVISAKLEAEYKLRETIALSFGASFEKVFRAVGDTKMMDTTSGTSFKIRDGAGGDYQSMALTIGIKGKF